MKKLALVWLIFVVGCTENSSDSTPQHSSIDSLTTESTSKRPQKANPPVTDGNYSEFYPNGTVKIKGQFKDGVRTGLWIAYYDNGNKWSENYYTKGKRNGHTVSFYRNGAIRYVGEYKADKKVGKWKFYNEKGEFVKVENY